LGERRKRKLKWLKELFKKKENSEKTILKIRAEDDKWFKAIGAIPDGPDYFMFYGCRFARDSDMAQALLLVRDIPYCLIELGSRPEDIARTLTMYAESGHLRRPEYGIFDPRSQMVQICAKVAQLRRR
jgi:hypothetical protein